MSTEDGALVRLGRAAAGIQRAPALRASANEEMIVFNLCVDTAVATRAAGQTDETSLAYGIAGELETNLVRRTKAAARNHRDKSLQEGCLDVARLFVSEVWKGVLRGRPPAQSMRRVLGSIYRIAFLQTCRERYGDKTDDLEETTAE